HVCGFLGWQNGSLLLSAWTERDLHPRQRFLPQGSRSPRMVSGQPRMAGSPVLACLLSRIQRGGTIMASYSGARNTQSLFQKPPRDPGVVAPRLPGHAAPSRAHLGLPASVSVTLCPFIYVRPYIASGILLSSLTYTNYDSYNRP